MKLVIAGTAAEIDDTIAKLQLRFGEQAGVEEVVRAFALESADASCDEEGVYCPYHWPQPPYHLRKLERQNR